MATSKNSVSPFGLTESIFKCIERVFNEVELLLWETLYRSRPIEVAVSAAITGNYQLTTINYWIRVSIKVVK